MNGEQILHDDELETLCHTRRCDWLDTELVHFLSFDSIRFSLVVVAVETLGYGIRLGCWAGRYDKPIYRFNNHQADGGTFVAGTPEDIRNYLLHQPLWVD